MGDAQPTPGKLGNRGSVLCRVHGPVCRCLGAFCVLPPESPHLHPPAATPCLRQLCGGGAGPMPTGAALAPKGGQADAWRASPFPAVSPLLLGAVISKVARARWEGGKRIPGWERGRGASQVVSPPASAPPSQKELGDHFLAPATCRAGSGAAPCALPLPVHSCCQLRTGRGTVAPAWLWQPWQPCGCAGGPRRGWAGPEADSGAL